MLWIMGLLYQMLVAVRDSTDDFCNAAFDALWKWARDHGHSEMDLLCQRPSRPFKAALVLGAALLCLALAGCVHGDPAVPVAECQMFYSADWYWTDAAHTTAYLVPTLDSIKGDCR